SLTAWIASRSCVRLMVADARMPRPPAALVADVSRAPATHPIPVCTIGTSQPKSSVTRVCSAGCVMCERAASRRDFAFAQPEWVDLLADEAELVVGRESRRRDLVGATGDDGDNEFEPGRGYDLLEGDAGMQRAHPHRVVGRLEVEHTE